MTKDDYKKLVGLMLYQATLPPKLSDAAAVREAFKRGEAAEQKYYLKLKEAKSE